VLTMLVAAAKINQSSIVPAFDQTRVPRIIQVPSLAVLQIQNGRVHHHHLSICRWPEVPRNPFPPLMPTVHDCVSQSDRGILSPLLKSYNAILDSHFRGCALYTKWLMVGRCAHLLRSDGKVTKDQLNLNEHAHCLLKT